MIVVLLISNLICVALGAGITFWALCVGGKLKRNRKDPGPRDKPYGTDEGCLHPVLLKAEYDRNKECLHHFVSHLPSEEWVKRRLRNEIANKICDELHIDYYTSWWHPGKVFARTKFCVERKE